MSGLHCNKNLNNPLKTAMSVIHYVLGCKKNKKKTTKTWAMNGVVLCTQCCKTFFHVLNITARKRQDKSFSMGLIHITLLDHNSPMCPRNVSVKAPNFSTSPQSYFRTLVSWSINPLYQRQFSTLYYIICVNPSSSSLGTVITL